MKITLKDGSVKEYASPMSIIDIAKDISEGLARVACLGEVDGEEEDLRTVIDHDCQLNILTAKDEAGLAALREARNHIENAEANLATCYLFINPALYGMIDDLDTTASRKALEGFAGIVKVPSGRFFNKVKLTASGAGGFTKDTGALAMNFIVIDKQAVIQYQKHTVSKIFTPEQNMNADAWQFNYRTVGIAETYDNKVDGIYVHTAKTAS